MPACRGGLHPTGGRKPLRHLGVVLRLLLRVNRVPATLASFARRVRGHGGSAVRHSNRLAIANQRDLACMTSISSLLHTLED